MVHKLFLPDVTLEGGDLVGVFLRLVLLSEQPHPMVEKFVPGQGHVEKGPPEAGDHSGRPSAVTAAKRSTQV